MKSMKKLLVVAASLVLCLTSCDDTTTPSTGGSSSTPSTSEGTSVDSPTTSDTGSTSDGGTSVSEVIPTFAKVIEQLQDEVAFSGVMQQDTVYATSGEQVSDVYNLETAISTEFYYQADYGEGSATPEYLMQLYKGSDGSVVNRFLNPVTNEVTEQVMTDDDGVTYVFDEEFGIFQTFTEDEFTYGNGEARRTLTEEEADFVTYALTGYTFNGVAEELVLSYDSEYNLTGAYVGVSGSGTSAVNGDYTYDLYIDFDVVDIATLGINHVEARDGSKSIAALDELFTSLKANNYTVAVSAVDSYSGTPTDYITGTIYTTPTMAIIEDTLNDQTIGYVQVEDRVAPVELRTDGKLHGTTTAVPGSLSETYPAFNYLSCMFDETAENEYTLANVTGLYDDSLITDMLPDYLMSEGGLLPDDGTYKLVDNTDGTWTLTYSYYYDFYGIFGSDVALTATISNIGTTSVEYTIDDYVAYVQPASWDEVSGATTLMAEYGITTELPFLVLDGLVFAAASYSYLYTTAIPADQTVDTIKDLYVDLLVEAGWVFEYTDSGWDEDYYSYATTDNRTLNIGLYCGSSSFYIYLYDQEIESRLSDWLGETFKEETLNYTIDSTITERIYAYDTETEEIGEQISAEEFTCKVQQTTDVQLVTGDWYVSEYAYVRRTTESGGSVIDAYSRDYETAGSSWVLEEAERGTTFYSSMYTMLDVASGGNYTEGSTEGEYVTTDSSTISAWASVLGFKFLGSSSYLGVDTITFNLDEENNTLTVNDWVMCDSAAYTTDDAGNRTYIWAEYSVSFTVSQIGSTVVDISEITGA